MSAIRVLVVGASGKMGREVVKAVTDAAGMDVVAAVDLAQVGVDAGVLAGLAPLNVAIQADLAQAIAQSGAQVMIDFTRPDVIMQNLRTAIPLGIAGVVGTTGLSAANLEELRTLSAAAKTPVFIAPNFAIGAVLMMQFAQSAAKFFDYAEVIEFHHEKKLDAPSGTALRTAELMRAMTDNRLANEAQPEHGEASRGMPVGNIRVHAVRLPGMVASQEVIFGGLGQTLTIRHDTINRESFMPGVVLAVRKVLELSGVVVGLEEIM
ncbi:MAG TPA: 4-hydroxy-tetrahydrodipicolinate reductase [Armatimonadota bacterium]|jgi:4-hydroxy-tetrahydrodipicolinate reductase